MTADEHEPQNAALVRRVVVTGIGLVTPFGFGREVSWSAIRAGRSATRWLTAEELGMDESTRSSWVGAPVKLPSTHSSSTPDEPVEPVVELAWLAAREACAHAALASSQLATDRTGIVIGTSKPGLRRFGHDLTGDAAASMLDWWPDAASRRVAASIQSGGPVMCPVAACATGLVSIIRAGGLIRSGECDVVLAGSSDASLVPIVLGSFQRLGVLARGFCDPASACRPFDAERSGFVIGEGAAVLALEAAESAAARGVTPLAEFLAGSLASDPSGLTQVDAEGTSLAWLIRDVLRRAEISPADVDYVNLHGTATRSNDLAETRAVRAAFGSRADELLCSSQKGGIGHLLGAAGSVEAAVSVLALRDQMVPPTVNLSVSDPACDLNYVPGAARSADLRHVLKLSLGFGGHLAAAAFRRWEP